MDRKIDFDVKAMKKRQYVAFAINGVIAFASYFMFLLGISLGNKAIKEIFLFIAFMEVYFTVWGIIRLLTTVPLKDIHVTAEYIKLNDVVYPNGTDYDIIYYLPAPSNEKLCVANLLGTRLIVRNKGDNTVRKFWTGPLRDRYSKLKRQELRDAITGVCNLDQENSVQKAEQTANETGEVEITVPRKEMFRASLKATLMFFGTSALSLIIFLLDTFSLISLLIMICFVISLFILIIMTISLTKVSKIPERIVINSDGVTIDDKKYPFSEYRISLWEGKKPRNKEIPSDERMYIVMEKGSERKEYWLGSAGYPFNRQRSSTIDMALRKYDVRGESFADADSDQNGVAE